MRKVTSALRGEMKKNELVWRELVDVAVVEKRRRWENVDDLAFRAGVAPATAAYALRRPVEIGAIKQHSAGFTVVNPEKVLTLVCAARSIVNDAHAVFTLDDDGNNGVFGYLREKGAVIDGGPAAAVALLGGLNTVSDYSEHVLYLRDEHAALAFDKQVSSLEAPRHTGYGRDRGNVTVLIADARAARIWGNHTSFTQTYADLFATPGWQSSEFRLALHERFLGTRDWDQE